MDTVVRQNRNRKKGQMVNSGEKAGEAVRRPKQERKNSKWGDDKKDERCIKTGKGSVIMMRAISAVSTHSRELSAGV